MSGTVARWVRKTGRARPGSQQTVLVELALAADDQGCAVRSSRGLAQQTGLGRNTVLRALRALETEDRIRRHVGDRNHCERCRVAPYGSAVYDIVMPGKIEVPDGQLNLLAGGPTSGPGPRGGWSQDGTTSGARVGPLKEVGINTRTPSPSPTTASRGTGKDTAPQGGNPNGNGSGHRPRRPRANGTNPRARGTNPRAVAAQPVRHEPPTVEDQLTWQSMREQMRQAAAGSRWDLWLAPLSLVGRDGDALVIGAPGDPGYVRASFSRLLAECAERAGRPGVVLQIERAEAVRA